MSRVFLNYSLILRQLSHVSSELTHSAGRSAPGTMSSASQALELQMGRHAHQHYMGAGVAPHAASSSLRSPFPSPEC